MIAGGGIVDPQDLAVAADFCKLVDTKDLFEYLGLGRPCSPEEAAAALADRRKHMQAMQSNPKFKDSAKALIKGFAVFQRVLAEPVDYMVAVDKAAELEKIPMLELALDSVLADGMITASEEAFVRQSAASLGISMETYERVLYERASARGVVVGQGAATPAPPAWAGGKTAGAPGGNAQPEPKLTGAGAGYAWWDAAFTRMLLDTIPGGPGDMVDIYCRTALSALTVLPVRRQLAWVGVDRSAERLEAARSQLPAIGNRVGLLVGEPHALPIPDASVDFVLSIRALANVADTRLVFAEALRVLRPGGRLICAEPDGLAESFVFDSHLADYNGAFHHLLLTVDAAMSAGADPIGGPGLALGPQLFLRMQHAGFRPLSIGVHGSNTLKNRTFGGLAKNLRRYPQNVARSVGLTDDHPAVVAVVAAVDRLEAVVGAERTGLGGQVLPIYLAVGVKD